MKKRSSKAAPSKNRKKKKPVRTKRVYPKKTRRTYQWNDEKETARLAALGKNFSGGRLFNGYVREALPMVIIVAVVMVAFLVTSVLFLHDALTMKLPADLETKTVQVNEIREDEDSVYFETDSGTMYTSKISVDMYDQMLEDFSPGDSFTVTCSKEDPAAMWEIRSSDGKEYLSPDHLLKDLRDNRLLVSAVCIAILIAFILLSIVANHILSNAPNYPRLSRLFVRREYLNINDNDVLNTQTPVPSPPPLEQNLMD